MTQKDLVRQLEAVGLPLAYRAFRSRQEPPFLCYEYVYDAVLYADDEVYWSAGHYQVELYTAQKDPDLEARVENTLAGLAWAKEAGYLAD